MAIIVSANLICIAHLYVKLNITYCVLRITYYAQYDTLHYNAL